MGRPVFVRLHGLPWMEHFVDLSDKIVIPLGEVTCLKLYSILFGVLLDQSYVDWIVFEMSRLGIRGGVV